VRYSQTQHSLYLELPEKLGRSSSQKRQTTKPYLAPVQMRAIIYQTKSYGKKQIMSPMPRRSDSLRLATRPKNLPKNIYLEKSKKL